jgi:hypothetical protein
VCDINSQAGTHGLEFFVNARVVCTACVNSSFHFRLLIGPCQSLHRRVRKSMEFCNKGFRPVRFGLQRHST